MLDVRKKKNLKQKLYPSADRVAFGFIQGILERNLSPEVRVLDAGCGQGTWLLRDYHGKIGRLVGTDVAAPGKMNMDDFAVSDLEKLPFKDTTFDVVVCYFVIEHLKHPQKVFAEFLRVLNYGGLLIFKTPCINAPVFFLSRYIPYNWQTTIKKATEGSHESDIFPTYYRCNTEKQLDRTLEATGFHKDTVLSVEQIYDYFSFNSLAYAASLVACRLIQALPWTKRFRSELTGIYRKPRNNDGTYPGNTGDDSHYLPGTAVRDSKKVHQNQSDRGKGDK